MQSRVYQRFFLLAKYICKNVLPQRKRRLLASSASLPIALFACGPLHAAPPFVQQADMSHVISYAAFVATLAFSIVSCLVFIRSRNNTERERDLLATELADLRAHSDRFESLIGADDQRFMIWPSAGDKPTVIGDLPETCAAPAKPSEFVAFGKWLAPASATALERHIATLRSEGIAFQLAIGTNAGNYLDAYGRTVGGRVFVRFRDLSGDQQIIMELRRKLVEKSSDVKIYQALLEEMHQPVWLRRKNGTDKAPIEWTNKAYRDAMEGGEDASAELLDRDARAEMEQAHKNGEPFKKRVYAVANGARRTYDVVSVPTETGSAGIATDVSEAEKAQAALNRTIKSHETTFNELATAVAIFDKSHKLTFHNNAYRDLFGLDEAFLASGPSDSEVIDKLRSLEKLPVEANFRQWKNNLLKTHQSLELQEFTWHLADGRTLRVVASPRSTGGATWIYENLTAQLNLESRVNVLSRLQAETLNRLSDGVAVFSSDGKLTLANASFLRLWGFDDKKLASNPHVNALAEACMKQYGCAEDWHKLKMAVVSVTDNRDEATGTMERPNGSVIRYSTNALIDGRTMVTFVDITDSVNFQRALTEKNEALHEADKLKTDFVKHVNYELRSPLTNIIGFAQLLSDADIGPLTEKQQEYTNYILSSSSSLLAIINDILDLATADAGVLELSLGEVSVKHIIKSAIEGLKDRLLDRKIRLTQTIGPNVGTFIGDERRMIQILFNLLSNAIQFSDEGSEVALHVSSKDRHLVFKVQDWGSGIPEVFINQVFNRFESRSSGNMRGGAGLGLSIVKRFVELHDGYVTVESKEGIGTTIACVIPAEPSPGKIAAE